MCTKAWGTERLVFQLRYSVHHHLYEMAKEEMKKEYYKGMVEEDVYLLTKLFDLSEKQIKEIEINGLTKDDLKNKVGK